MTATAAGWSDREQGGLDFGSGAGPGRPGQVIRLHPETRQRHLDWLTWGLLPHATTDPDEAPRPIHARAEAVAAHPVFGDAFRHRRAIVPATEYYQRRTVGEPGRRYAISRNDGQPMAIAGLWEAFRRPNGEIERTYCIITTSATGAVAEIHDRMPLVLDEADWAVWLGEAPGDPAALLRPSADDVLVLKPIRARRSPAASAHRGKAARV
ncbi:SOS response-associated peptidase [Limobrevibacterium gyesilva]|uniref:Abasic site processing protein n=1 Tax=Limobrevibacterium gyesilva TaxID=2991712 RepID=A0AA41YVX4_9PROT|nr:SOS response-associated peptidase [Limobrevibacterium gyesilva]MCW3477458.1 SOS response-associated peptidase [Limobrevibacterium gyesilva]